MSTIFIDTETTGLSLEHDEILEISIINQDGDILLDTLVQPINKIEWPEAEDIHGISLDMIVKAGSPTLAQLIPSITSIIAEHDNVVIYNMGYDKAFLDKAMREHYSVIPSFPGTTWHCAMQEFAETYGEWDQSRNQYKWQKLTVAADHVGHTWEGKAHRALADCQATLSVWEWLTEQKEWYETAMINHFPVLKYFKFRHLPPHLAKVSEKFHRLAWDIVKNDPDLKSIETGVAIRKLLESKDAAVRAAL